MRSGRLDLTRFEFYSAPFRIEPTSTLRERLSGTWEGREPQT